MKVLWAGVFRENQENWDREFAGIAQQHVTPACFEIHTYPLQTKQQDTPPQQFLATPQQPLATPRLCSNSSWDLSWNWGQCTSPAWRSFKCLCSTANYVLYVNFSGKHPSLSSCAYAWLSMHMIKIKYIIEKGTCSKPRLSTETELPPHPTQPTPPSGPTKGSLQH